MDFSGCEFLKVSWRKPTVLEITLARPQFRNSFHDGVIQEFHQVLDKLYTLPPTQWRALVLSGEGAGFCAGGDMQWLQEGAQQSYEVNLASTQELSRLFNRLLNTPVPVIGKVHGFAIGGAVGFIAGCDVVIAAEATQFSLGEARIGLVPACVAPVLLRKLGASRCHQLMLTGLRFNSQQAQQIGLIHDVVQIDDLDKACDRWVTEILQGAPLALRETKNLLLKLSQISAEQDQIASATLARLRASPEAKEGVASFQTKTSPSWRIT